MSRHAVDRIEFLAVEGWALTSDGQQADVELWCDGEPMPAELSRLPRPDVQAHFGGSVALDCGFELRLDAASWWRRCGGRPIQCALHVAGVVSAELEVTLDGAELVAWIDAVGAAPASSWRTAEWARLQPLLASDVMGSGDLPQWAQCCWQQGGQTPPATWRAAVERIDGFLVSGWVGDAAASSDGFVVHCHRLSWPVRAQRTARDDVLRALPDVDPRCGFEIELPSDIWSATPEGADAWIQLSVNGLRLLPRPRRLSRRALESALLAALQWWECRDVAECSEIAGTAWLMAAEQAFGQALVLEHALAAGLLSQLPADAQARLRGCLAEHDAQILERWMPSDPERLATFAEPTEDARSIWHLQQTFNTALGEAISAGQEGAAALRQTLQDLLTENGGVPADRVQFFLASLIPTFCSANALPALRPLLTGDHLDLLERHDGRWELSLLLPLRLRDELPTGRLTATLALMQRMARPGASGWLNTVTVWDVIAQVHQALLGGTLLDDVEVHQLVEATLDLWTSLSTDPPWSRMHDQCLVDGHVMLLRCCGWLDERLSDRVLQSALRHYALAPAFWRAARQGMPAAEWPPLLVAKQSRVEPALQELTHEVAEHQIAELQSLLAWARADGHDEVSFLQRHALLASVDHSGWMVGLPEADRLRVSLKGDQADRAWRQVCPVPWPSQVTTRAAAWGARRELGDAVTANDPHRRRVALHRLQAASGERAGFVGLPLLLQVARMSTASVELSAEAGEAFAESLDFSLATCAMRPAEHQLPPAALCAVGMGLTDWSSQTDAPNWVHSSLQRWSSAHAKMWEAGSVSWRASSPGPVELQAALPGVDVLVVLRESVSGEATGSKVEPSPWIDALRNGGFGQGHGFDLCRWDPAGSAGHAGEPVRLTQPSLLGLLRYLFERSDYGQFFLIDAGTEPATGRWLARTGVMTAHYHGAAADPASTHQVLLERSRLQFDLSATGLPVARVATGLGLSRQALGWALALYDDVGSPAWLTRVVDEERLLAKLLAAAGVSLDQRGYWLCHARPGPGYLDAPLPDEGGETVLTVGRPDGALGMGAGELTGRPRTHLSPRIWPTDRVPSLVGALGSQQLVRLKDPWAGVPSTTEEVGVFAVARNERVLLPHFLAHYRALGVRRFTIADNLSDDGTREYLLCQPDVMLYSVDTPYKLSHYGVAWQQAMLAAHAQGRWALVVDIDELLVWPGCESESLAARCAHLAAGGYDAALALMVDMYPEGPLDAADFERGAPFVEAPCFDAAPVKRWRLGSGSYSNSPSYVSSARHRMLPGSPPNHYTAQKVPLLRYHPFVRWSDGLHYAAGVRRAPDPLFLAHFKYHRGFRAKVEEEVARKQHYNDAEEYRKYRALWTEASGIMFDPAVSRRYVDSQSFADIRWN